MRHYGQIILKELSAEEFQILMKLADRVIGLLEQEQTADAGQCAAQRPGVKKIVIE